METVAWEPVVDGYFLKAAPIQALKSKNFNPVPVLIGNNSGEYAGAKPSMADDTAAQYEQAVEGIYPSQPLTAQTLYSVYYNPEFYDCAETNQDSSYSCVSQAIGAFLTDFHFSTSTRNVARGLSLSGPAYRYVFTQPLFKGYQELFKLAGDSPNIVKAFHGEELIYVFQNVQNLVTFFNNGGTAEGISLPAGTTLDPLPSDMATQAAALRYWGNFAYTRNPNVGGVGQSAFANWPTYQVSTDPYLNLSEIPATGNNYHGVQCDLFNSYYNNQGQ